jgi:hypothetical protein
MSKVSWKPEPQAHDYPAAAAYLSLIAAAAQVDDMVDRLKTGPLDYYKAKDILRAAALALLPTDDPHVASDLRKIAQSTHLSPVLLVRGDFSNGFPLQIADGYHRVCATYHVDENTDIPCRIVERGDAHA